MSNKKKNKDKKRDKSAEEFLSSTADFTALHYLNQKKEQQKKNLQFNDTFKQLLPPLTDEELAGLEENILAEGIRQPLCVWNNYIIDGHNRYNIARKHNLPFEMRKMNFKNQEQAKIWIIKEQFSRRNISNYTRAQLALQLKPMLAQKAKKNQGARTDLLETSPKSSTDTRAQLAKIAGVSDNTISKVEYIEKHATPDIKEQLKRGTETINKVHRDLKRQQRSENIKTTIPVMPDGIFNVIYADPPWQYEHSKSDSRKIENHYPTMELENIKSIKIPSADDSVLFLWATAPKLLEALEVMKAWGFEYKTHAIWNKKQIGTGYWFRGQHELFMVGTKGNVYAPEEENRKSSFYSQEGENEKDESSVYSEKRTEHSRKPDYYYQLIENTFPNGKYLELFARQQYSDKWETYGNQIIVNNE